MTPPEGKVKAKVKNAIGTFLPRSYRFMPVQNGMGAPGLDFYYCISGYFVAIETKAPGKKMTTRQVITASAIRDAGGLVFVVDGDETLKEMLECLKYLETRWPSPVSTKR